MRVWVGPHGVGEVESLAGMTTRCGERAQSCVRGVERLPDSACRR